VITNASGGPLDRTTDREDWLDLIATARLRRPRIHDYADLFVMPTSA
jgi:hypothetical protein